MTSTESLSPSSSVEGEDLTWELENIMIAEAYGEGITTDELAAMSYAENEQTADIVD
jgi:hypothetical protein